MTRKQRKYKGITRMGMSKHRKSGSSQFGPRIRHLRAIEANENDRTAPESQCIYKTVREALEAQGDKHE